MSGREQGLPGMAAAKARWLQKPWTENEIDFPTTMSGGFQFIIWPFNEDNKRLWGGSISHTATKTKKDLKPWRCTPDEAKCALYDMWQDWKRKMRRSAK